MTSDYMSSCNTGSTSTKTSTSTSSASSSKNSSKKDNASDDENEDAMCRALFLSSMSPTSVTGTAPEQTPPPLCIEPVLPDVSSSAQRDNDRRSWPLLQASHKSLRTTNPIRAIVDPVLAAGPMNAETISLALGDPTAYLEPCPVAVSAVQEALSNTSNTSITTNPCCAGYVNACGTDAARRAIAAHHRTPLDNVIVASGCSGALELALTALLDTDSILLVPQPGFPLYQVIAESHGARVVHYRLLQDKNWQIDLDHVRELLQQELSSVGNSTTTTTTPAGGAKVIRGMVVNNPSNPTGAVYSRQHLREVCAVCDQYQIPIVADEIYGDLVLDGHTFHPLASVAEEMGRRVPVITASGIGKQYLLPGWRVGWIAFQDK